MTPTFAPAVGALLRDEVGTVLVDGDEVLVDADPDGPLVVPGSFDPLHEGHLTLARHAADAVAAAGHGDRRVLFELSVRNVDKPPLGVAEVTRRVEVLRDHGAVVVTTAPRFDDKAGLLPGAVFAVGHDTAARLVDPAYYADAAARDRALQRVADAGCLVAVAGRAVAGGPYRTLGDVDVPAGFESLFLPVPGVRVDVSSTALREGGGPASG